MAKMKSKRKSHHRHRPISGGAPPSGYIFICDRVTKPECFQFQVFGLPMSRIDTVVRIEPGAPLFLFDCELRILYGVYGAASHGGANLVPHAFGGKFPAQVKFHIERNCDPLPESVFKHAILENYSKGKFRPDLDYQQVSRLLQLFKDTTVPPQPPPPPPVDSQYAPQSVRHPTSSQYVISSAPPPPYNNNYYSACPNASYSPAPSPSLLHLPPTAPAPAPAPAPRNQYYAQPTNYLSVPLPLSSSNNQYNASHSYYPAKVLQPQSNDQYYAAPPYYLAQIPQALPNYQHNPAPSDYPGQLLPLPTTPSASHQQIQHYPAAPVNPYYTQNCYPGNAVPA